MVIKLTIYKKVILRNGFTGSKVAPTIIAKMEYTCLNSKPSRTFNEHGKEITNVNAQTYHRKYLAKATEICLANDWCPVGDYETPVAYIIRLTSCPLPVGQRLRLLSGQNEIVAQIQCCIAEPVRAPPLQADHVLHLHKYLICVGNEVR